MKKTREKKYRYFHAHKERERDWESLSSYEISRERLTVFVKKDFYFNLDVVGLVAAVPQFLQHCV